MNNLINEQQLKNLRGKYIKQVLLRLEQTQNTSTLQPEVRKIILDGFNDFVRDLFVLLQITEDISYATQQE